MKPASDPAPLDTPPYPGPSLLERLGADSRRLMLVCLNLAYGPVVWAILFGMIRRHLADSDGVRAGMWGGAILWLLVSTAALAISIVRHRDFRDRTLESPVASLPVSPGLCRWFVGARWSALANLIVAPLLGVLAVSVGGSEMFRGAVGGGLFIAGITWLPASWAWAAAALEDHRTAAELCHCERHAFARSRMVSSRHSG